LRRSDVLTQPMRAGATGPRGPSLGTLFATVTGDKRCAMADLRRSPFPPYAVRVLAAVWALVVAAPAFAQPAPHPAPPLALVVPAPAPAFLPPTRDPPELTGVSVDLERRGHQKKLTGASLMAVGSLVAVTGLGLLLDGAINSADPRLCGGRCSGNDLVVAGSIGLAIGTAAAATGIPVWLSGVGDARRALRLRDRLSLPPPGGIQF
jgi:hypothetical protein